LITTHTRPDGDAIGSLLALTLLLDDLGKAVTPALAEGPPARLKFLPGSDRIGNSLQEDADLLITVDCSDFERTAFIFPPESTPTVNINIDHHPTNDRFAEINLVDPTAAATAEIIFDLASENGWNLTPDIATNLLTGIVTDTIGFSTPSTNERTFEIAASLVHLGAPIHHIYDLSLKRKTFASVQYWARGLGQLERQGDLVWATLTLEDRKTAAYPGSDDADLINLLQTIENARITLVFVEQPKGKVKVSWRSEVGINVAAIAENFGGGGHAQAAGAMIEGDVQTVRDTVLAETQALLGTSEERMA
jgi:phosphoesterase RecJ-like protein